MNADILLFAWVVDIIGNRLTVTCYEEFKSYRFNWIPFVWVLWEWIREGGTIWH